MMIIFLRFKKFLAKKSTLIFISGLTIMTTSCIGENETSSFHLYGTIDKDIPEFIIMKYGKIVDTAIINNNEFLFKGSVDFPAKAEFFVIPASTMDKPFYLENNNLNVSISIEKKKYKGIDVNFITLDSIKGSKTEKIRKDFENFEKEYGSKNNHDSALFLKIENVIEKNASNSYSGYLLLEAANKKNLKQEELQLLFSKLDTISQDKGDLRSIERILFPEKGIRIGKKMIDFSLPNDKDIMMNTSKYRGKTLLIDFWASWCAPCRKQNPELIRIYNQEKLEILGVSIDTKKDNWLTAIENDNIPWDNVLEIRGFESDILRKYGVLSSIPSNFLIDESGIVIGIDVSLEKLEQYLVSVRKVEK